MDHTTAQPKDPDQPSPHLLRAEGNSKKKTQLKKKNTPKVLAEDRERISRKRAIARKHGIKGYLYYLTAPQKTVVAQFFQMHGWQTGLPRTEAEALARLASDAKADPVCVSQTQSGLVPTIPAAAADQTFGMSRRKRRQKTPATQIQPTAVQADFFSGQF